MVGQGGLTTEIDAFIKTYNSMQLSINKLGTVFQHCGSLPIYVFYLYIHKKDKTVLNRA